MELDDVLNEFFTNFGEDVDNLLKDICKSLRKNRIDNIDSKRRRKSFKGLNRKVTKLLDEERKTRKEILYSRLPKYSVTLILESLEGKQIETFIICSLFKKIQEIINLSIQSKFLCLEKVFSYLLFLVEFTDLDKLSNVSSLQDVNLILADFINSEDLREYILFKK